MNSQTDYEKAKENIAQKECGGDPYSETVFQHGFDFGRKYTIEQICAWLRAHENRELTVMPDDMLNIADKIEKRFK